MVKISMVLPVYNEEGNLQILYDKIKEVMVKSPHEYEILFVLDPCTDNSEKLVENIMGNDQNVKLISFTRNFGKEAALIAGIISSKGDAVITMDSDLQHPPELIGELIKKWQQGFDVVNTVRNDINQKNFFKKITSKYFYKIFSYISDVNLEEGGADFRLIDKKVVESIKQLHENDIFLRGIISWFGYPQTSIPYLPHDRFSGKTKFDIVKMIKLAFSGISSFSIVPLRLITYLGFIVAMFSFLYMILTLYITIFLRSTVSGYPTIISSVLFLGGVQLIAIGILGEYIGKILLEAKQRPRYIIKYRKGW
jgi:polyisoprenyl-phosphate glycosyltransferase